MTSDNGLERRAFLKGAAVGGAATATMGGSATVLAQGTTPAATPAGAPSGAPSGGPAGYQFLKPDEAAFVEAMVEISPRIVLASLSPFWIAMLAQAHACGMFFFVPAPAAISRATELAPCAFPLLADAS